MTAIEEAPDGAPGPPGGEKPGRDDAVWAALAFRNAADELIRLAKVTRSLGLLSWGFGIAFAGTAVGLRFWSAADMEAAEFISCVVFASVLVLGGYCLYVLESRGYVSLVSEIVTRDLDGQAKAELPRGSGHAAGADAAPELPDAPAAPAPPDAAAAAADTAAAPVG